MLHAVACIAIAAWFSLSIFAEYNRRVEAALAQPPRPVDLTMFRAERDTHLGGEVHVTAQVDRSALVSLPGQDGEKLVAIGLLGATGRSGDAPDAMLLLGPAQVAAFDNFVEKHFLTQGRVGPRISIDGHLVYAPRVVESIAEYYAGTGQRLPSDFVLIRPFLAPRIVVMAPRPTLVWLLPILPLTIGFLLFGTALRSWATTPCGMYRVARMQLHWRRVLRASGVRRVERRRHGFRTYLFNPFAWWRAVRISVALVRRTIRSVVSAVRKRRRRLDAWFDRKTTVALEEGDPFTRFASNPAGPAPQKRVRLLFDRNKDDTEVGE